MTQHRGRVLGAGPLQGTRAGQQVQGLRSQRPSWIGGVRVTDPLLALRRRSGRWCRWGDRFRDAFGLGLLEDLLDCRRQRCLLTPVSAALSW